MQKLVSGADQAIQPRLFQPHLAQEHLGLFGVQLADLFLDPGADDDVRIALRGGHLGHGGGMGVAFDGFLFGDVTDVEHGLRAEKLQHLPGLGVLGVDLGHEVADLALQPAFVDLDPCARDVETPVSNAAADGQVAHVPHPCGCVTHGEVGDGRGDVVDEVPGDIGTASGERGAQVDGVLVLGTLS